MLLYVIIEICDVIVWVVLCDVVLYDDYGDYLF